MIEKIISWSIHNRFIVIVVAIIISIYGIVQLLNTPVDAIPDLSVNQVIVFTEWMGRNPQIMDAPGNCFFNHYRMIYLLNE